MWWDERAVPDQQIASLHRSVGSAPQHEHPVSSQQAANVQQPTLTASVDLDCDYVRYFLTRVLYD